MGATDCGNDMAELRQVDVASATKISKSARVLDHAIVTWRVLVVAWSCLCWSFGLLLAMILLLPETRGYSFGQFVTNLQSALFLNLVFVAWLILFSIRIMFKPPSRA